MSIGILSSALSGLAAFQRSLEVTSNNISNANTEGYSRQRVELQSSPEQFVGHGYLGSGVNATNIKRSYDEFINGQVRSSSTAFHDVESFYALSSQIDNLLANESTGMASAMKTFFNAVNDVANDPTSLPARQVMLSEAFSMTQQFNTMGDRFDDMRQQVNNNLDTAITEVNGYAESLAILNNKIKEAIGKTSGQQLPNELMDQRDLLLTKISEKMDVSAVSQPDGSFSVFMGQGQPLVLGNTASRLLLLSDPANPNQMLITLNGQDISKNLTGGEIYGNLRFREQMLDSAQQQVGFLATGLATEFNKIHSTGYDLNNNTGVAFFDLGSPEVQVKSQARDKNLVVTAGFVLPASALNLGASYRVNVTATGPDSFSLVNLSDNTTTSGLTAATLASTAATNGFSLNFSGGALTVGDSFQISPHMNVAKSLRVNPAINTPLEIAAAGASGLVGDNSNILKLGKLESNNLMMSGKSSLIQVYEQLVGFVGSQTHSASISRSAQKVLLNQSIESREDLAGVNLDEEAANLIKFQNAYQAAAKAASVASGLFDTLIGSMR